VREGLGSKCSLVIQYASTFISGIVVGVITSWKLTLVVMAVGPFFIGTSAYLARVSYETSHMSFRGSYVVVYLMVKACKTVTLPVALNWYGNFSVAKSIMRWVVRVA
jgi:hypothetical protein